MKKSIVTVLFLTFCLVGYCTNYYVSSSGNDANAGTSTSTSWRTIARVNFQSYSFGDSILFKRGDTWNEVLRPNKDGAVYSAYGSGEKPKITAFQAYSNWDLVSSGIYQSGDISVGNNVNILTINGVSQILGRTPNNGSYYAYQSATSTNLISTSLTGTPDYKDAEVVYRAKHYQSYKAKIVVQSGNEITYIKTANIDPSSNGLSLSSGDSAFGFFLQKHASTLDQVGEWFLDTTTGKMQVYFGALNPASYTVKVPVYDTLVNLALTVQNITLENLQIEGANYFGVFAKSGANIVIKNCDFLTNTIAVMMQNCDGSTFSGNTVTNSLCNGFSIIGRQSGNYSVINNSITNTGQSLGQGVFNYDYQLKGIALIADSDRVSNTNLIQYNNVINTGFTGIEWQGSNVTVKNNYVDTFCNVNDDGGGIYTFTSNTVSPPSKRYTNRVIDSNVVANNIGTSAGYLLSEPDAGTGIYFDDQTENATCTGNTIFNCAGNGIQANNPVNLTLRNNTVYNAKYVVSVIKKPYSSISNLQIRANQLYPTTSVQYNFSYVDQNLSAPTSQTLTQSLTDFAYIDSSYISQPRTTGYYYYYSPNGSTYYFPTPLTVGQWQSYGHDSTYTVFTPNRFIYNETNSNKTVSLNGNAVDAFGNLYYTSVVLAPYTSKALYVTAVPQQNSGKLRVNRRLVKQTL